MPLTERDPNVGSRESRASNMSAISQGKGSLQPPKLDGFPDNVGVMSMLKTSTELGDIGALAGGPSRLPKMPRAVPRRSALGVSSRMSGPSSHPRTSRSMPQHHAWPSESSGRRPSITSNLTVPTYMPEPLPTSVPYSSPPTPDAHPLAGGRSYSMTQASRMHPSLGYHRSYASLRSQEYIPRPESPYRYPTRLRRPSYRPASPALSDMTGHSARHMRDMLRESQHQAQAFVSHLPRPMAQVPYQQSRASRSTPSVSPHTDSYTRTPYHQGRNRSNATLQPAYSGYTLKPHMDDSSSPLPSSPDTPKDADMSVHVEVHAGAHRATLDLTGPASDPDHDGPLYYDYSESCTIKEAPKPAEESSDSTEPTSSQPVPVGFVNRIKSILEGRANIDQASLHTSNAVVTDFAELPGQFPAELPGDTPMKRLTRDLVLAALQPSSVDHTRNNTQASVDLTGLMNEATGMIEGAATSPVSALRASEVLAIAAATPMPLEFEPKEQKIEEHTEEIQYDKEEKEHGSTTVASFTNGADSILDFGRRCSARAAAQEEAGDSGAEAQSVRTVHTASVEERSVTTSNHTPSSSKGTSPGGASSIIARALSNVRPASECSSSPPLSGACERISIPVPMRPRPMTTMTAPSQLPDNFTASFPVPKACQGKPCHLDAEKTAVDQLSDDFAASFPVLKACQGKPCHLDAGDKVIDEVDDRPVQSEGQGHPKVYDCTPPVRTSSEVPGFATDASSQSRLSSETRRHRDSNTTTHLSWNPRMRMQTPVEVYRPSERRFSGEETTTDLRLSAFRYPQPHQLPQLKEEPHEDSSMSDRRSSRATLFKFPHPRGSTRHSSVQGSVRNSSVEEARLSRRDTGRSYFRQSGNLLADIRNIPSLNFSRMDLIAKMNEALGYESDHPVDFADAYEQAMDVDPSKFERPSSAGQIRDKYKSFFASLDDIKPLDPRIEQGGVESTAEIRSVNSGNDSASIYSKRPYSPQEVIEDVNRLSIPSVGALTQRLSDMLPSFRRFCTINEQLESAVSDAHSVAETLDGKTVDAKVDEIRELGRRPAIDSKNSFARLRPVPGKPTLVVVEDDLYDKLTQISDQQETATVTTTEMTIPPRTSSLPLHLRPKDANGRPLSATELEVPSSALIRVQSPTTGAIEILHVSPKPSLVSVASSRPWNSTKNYPWADKSDTMEIRFPADAHHRDSGVIGPSRLRIRTSMSSDSAPDGPTTSTFPTETTTRGDSVATQITFKQQHTRRGSKRSIIGSMTRKIRSPFDKHGFPTGPSLLQDDINTHDPGDRYPTTGLSPPIASNIEEARSFFSDDSSCHERQGAFHKRLTQLRASGPRPKTALRPQTALDDDRLSPALNSLGHDSEFEHTAGSFHTYDAATTMPKIEFCARRMLQRLRTIWIKGGDLVRTLSGRKKPDNDTRQWLEDSDVYEGT